MSEPLRLLSIGAGAIGTYIGGSLALHGHRVVFVERSEVAEKLRSTGLKLNLSGKDNHLADPVVLDSMEEALAAHRFDAALFALKSFDTPAFLNSLTLDELEMPPILCLSNGVGNEPAIAEALGEDKVIAGTVTTAIGCPGAGQVVLEKLRGVGVADEGELSERLVKAMDGAGLQARLYHDATDMKWSKLLTNLLANASSAILDMSPAEIFAHPGTYRLEIRQLREAMKVMAVQGIDMVDLPGIPVRLLSMVVRRMPLAVSRPILRRKVGAGRGGKMPSFHIDLHGGRGRSEVDFLNGAVVRAGESAGVKTPVNRLLNRTLLALTRGDIPLDHYRGQPERLLAELN
jgi:2-dehydropantoate 2-reductase